MQGFADRSTVHSFRETRDQTVYAIPKQDISVPENGQIRRVSQHVVQSVDHFRVESDRVEEGGHVAMIA